MANATRDEALWAEEVAHVLKNASAFELTARLMLCEVLVSLIADPMLDRASRRDVWTMLEAISRPALQAV